MKSNRVLVLLLVSVSAMAAGCNSPVKGLGGNPGPTPEPTPRVGEMLSPTQHLVRASMALRGQRPSAADLDLVLADPSALPAIVDGYLDEPAFGRTIRDLHDEAFLLRAEVNQNLFATLDSGVDGSTLFRSVMEQPLRQIEHVVMNDKPYTEIVTGNYTVADPVYAKVWGIPHPGGAGWRVTHWEADRPEAGVLSSSTLALRYSSPGANYNRQRANAFSRALLCYDFLDNDIVVDGSVDLSNPDQVQQAVRNNESCKACHDTLDPLASFFFGHNKAIRTNDITAFPVPGPYARTNETDWMTTNDRRPSFFGRDGDRLNDLGTFIAEDPRFSSCAARRFYSYLQKVPLAAVPAAEVEALDAAFVAANFDAKLLAREIVLSESFRRSHSATADGADALVGYKKASPEQLSAMFEDLTGFRWTANAGNNVKGSPWGPVDLLTSDLVGYRSLAGGIDSYYVTTPSETVNTTTMLVLEAIAARSAGVVVDADFARILPDVSPSETAEQPIRAQLARLQLRLYGVPVSADSAEVDAAWELFAATLARTGDVRHAWKTTLTAHFSDLRIAYY